MSVGCYGCTVQNQKDLQKQKLTVFEGNPQCMLGNVVCVCVCYTFGRYVFWGCKCKNCPLKQ